MERTYIMIKPDGVQRGLIGTIINRFEQKGYKLIAMKLWSPPRSFMEKHYADLSGKGFFDGLIKYMISGPVVSMVWEGANVVLEGRKMLGATKPSDSEMGTIRGDFCIEVGRNVCHGSDSVESAENEIALWFPEGTSRWDSCAAAWIYEKPVKASTEASACACDPCECADKAEEADSGCCAEKVEEATGGCCATKSSGCSCDPCECAEKATSECGCSDCKCGK